jgi:hypothetical protein
MQSASMRRSASAAWTAANGGTNLMSSDLIVWALASFATTCTVMDSDGDGDGDGDGVMEMAMVCGRVFVRA